MKKPAFVPFRRTLPKLDQAAVCARLVSASCGTMRRPIRHLSLPGEMANMRDSANPHPPTRFSLVRRCLHAAAQFPRKTMKKDIHPELRGNASQLRLWQLVHHAQHSQRAEGRYLQQLPSVLYGQAEVRRHSRPHREIPKQVCGRQLRQPATWQEEGRQTCFQVLATLSFRDLRPPAIIGTRWRGFLDRSG